jgi:histidyl-tRNA synthetase
MRFQAPRGTEDVLPGASHTWQHIESVFRSHVAKYGYEEIRTPTFEETELFLRSAGETSEIVTKQMYDFLDKGGRSNTLKAEGTAPAMRAMIEHNLLQQIPQRISYITPVFRYERPQKGRLREHHQVGIELIGSSSPAADAEVIEIAVRFYEALGLSDFSVLINSIGRQECRVSYQAALMTYAQAYVISQSEDSQDRIRKNPLRLLDSKDSVAIELMNGAPCILDFLEPESKANFDELKRLLDHSRIRYEVAPHIVRGLDYYTETVFELQVDTIGAQSAIGGGGRYDNLIRELGGPDTPSVGFGIGLERALLTLEAAGISWQEPGLGVFVVIADSNLLDIGRSISDRLRQNGVSVVMEYDGRSMKSQLKQADRSNSRFACIIGEDEVKSNSLTIRDLSTSTQQSLPTKEAIDFLCGP